MAKKITKPAAQLVRIPTKTAEDGLLSKAQKEFNRLSTRIVNLERDVANFREAATRLRQRVQTEYRPLQARHNDQRAALVRHLDRAFGTRKLTKVERKKIVNIIVNCCYDLVDRGYADLQAILEKHAPPESEMEAVAADVQTSEALKMLFSQQFGIKFDPAVDVTSREKFEAYVAQQMAEKESEFAEQEAQQAEHRAQRPKTAKQKAAEEKKLTEEKNITKSVRTLYMELVKALHPDREPDEAEKTRKTALLQQVTAAYEKNELLTLLRLQLELLHIDQAHLSNLAEEQLRYYNKLLREQVRELDETLYEEQLDLSGFTGQPPYMMTSPVSMEYDFKRQKTKLETKINLITAEILAFEHDPAALKAFLKTHRLPKVGPGPVFI